MQRVNLLIYLLELQNVRLVATGAKTSHAWNPAPPTMPCQLGNDKILITIKNKEKLN